MTLKQDELIDALHDGVKAAATCSVFCRYGAEVDEHGYICWHNGTGVRDTDTQIVRNQTVLGLNREYLGGKIKAWLEGVHKGEPPDLNAS